MNILIDDIMVQDEIVKKTYWMQGIITVIAMGILELFILVFSAMKNIKFENIKGPEISPAFEPFIFSLLQILPIILIEVGYYYIKNSGKMRVADIGPESKIDRVTLGFYRTKRLIRSGWMLFVIILVAVAFIASIIVMLNEDLVFNIRTAMTFSVLLVYVALIRPAISYLNKNKGKIKLDFLVSLSFWAGIGLIIFGVIALYGVIFKGGQNMLWIPGILFTLLSPFVIYGSVFPKYVTFEFQNWNLVLNLPMGRGSRKKATVPINKITKCIKISGLEEMSLQQSFMHQHINQIKSSASYINFLRGKVPYPSKLVRGVAFPKVYLKGSDFDFIISIKNADEFVSQVNSYIPKLRSNNSNNSR